MLPLIYRGAVGTPSRANASCSISSIVRYLYRAMKARFLDDREEVKFLQEVVVLGTAVVDAGAYKGSYLYWLQRYASPRGRVFAFEPQPALYRYLKSIKERMGWAHVEIMPQALSDHEGTGTLKVPGASPEGTSPGASLDGQSFCSETWHEFPIATRTLDDVVSNGVRVSAIKCDVEGHELAVLVGSRRIIEHNRPALVVEAERRHHKEKSIVPILEYIRGLGYEGWFVRSGRRLPLKAFDENRDQPFAPGRFWERPDYVSNFLFRPCRPEDSHD